ncbi:MAG: hypothetical protein ACREMH_02010 [Gemmatimonadales bacterium]
MTPDLTQWRVRAGMTVFALCCAACGAVLLFAPDGASGLLFGGSEDGTLLQLLGAAMLGFGAMNWVARGAVLGGIYGRAVVAGNQTHLTVGALLLAARGIEAGITAPAFWAVTGCYVLGAGFFGYLTFGGVAPRAG